MKKKQYIENWKKIHVTYLLSINLLKVTKHSNTWHFKKKLTYIKDKCFRMNVKCLFCYNNINKWKGKCEKWISECTFLKKMKINMAVVIL